jgi:hypothetical protein
MLAVGKSKGRPKAIPDWAIKRLKQELSDPEGFESYKEVQIWLEAVLGIEATIIPFIIWCVTNLKLNSKFLEPEAVNNSHMP